MLKLLGMRIRRMDSCKKLQVRSQMSYPDFAAWLCAASVLPATRGSRSSHELDLDVWQTPPPSTIGAGRSGLSRRQSLETYFNQCLTGRPAFCNLAFWK
jgi:hypothetical protein